MFKKAISLFIALLICITVIVPAFASDPAAEKSYEVIIPMVPDDGLFNIYEDEISIGWGSILITALEVTEGESSAIEKDAVWTATLPDGSTAAPREISGDGYAYFAIPYEMTGVMTVTAEVDGSVADELEVAIVDTDIKGNEIRGWSLSFKKWYYILEDGTLARGWTKIDGKWYFFDDDGIMQKGWVKDAGKWYYLDKGGVMQKGWVKDAGKWYYLQKSGAMAKNQWIKYSGKWYYVKSSGAMVTGTYTIGSKTYTFNKNGVWIA